MLRIRILKLNKLRCHEEVSKRYVEKLKIKIQKEKRFTSAIFVDKKSGVILDGHHRYYVACSLNLRKIPCICVNYLEDYSIQVLPRRKMSISKDEIIQKALGNNRFPYKTTKHMLNGIPTHDIQIRVNIPLSELKR